jgi:excisionase family DNA binding protein
MPIYPLQVEAHHRRCTMAEQIDKLLTVAETSDRLGISLAVVYALCSARKIRHERHGLKRRKILIPESALEEYRRDRTVEVEEERRKEAPPPLPNFKHLHV